MSLKPRFFLVFALVSVGIAVMASSASATFHLQKIREISPGTDASDDSYVEIQAYADFQNFLHFGAALAHLRPDVCKSPGLHLVHRRRQRQHPGHGAVRRQGCRRGSKDFNVNLNLGCDQGRRRRLLPSEPGFSDCVSWGNFNANSALMANYGTTAGTPAPALTSGMALRRSIAAGCPTLLEPGDDTNNSAADFSVAHAQPAAATPSPRRRLPCAPAGGGRRAAHPSRPRHQRRRSARRRRSAPDGRRTVVQEECKKKK